MKSKLTRAQRKQPSGLHVILIVRGGVAHVLFKPLGINLSIYDYDWEAADENDPHLSRDPNGRVCLYQEFGPSQAIMELKYWTVIRKAEQGVYWREWKCPKCGHLTRCSYEDLAETGTPICTDCDLNMDLR
jgi:hypothetical protein